MYALQLLQKIHRKYNYGKFEMWYNITNRGFESGFINGLSYRENCFL